MGCYAITTVYVYEFMILYIQVFLFINVFYKRKLKGIYYSQDFIYVKKVDKKIEEMTIAKVSSPNAVI